MRVLSLCVLLFFAIPVVAQNKQTPQPPDYKKIAQTIKDESSPWFYPKLYKRYQDDDTTLSLKDYHFLYYGYFFNKNYSAMGHISVYMDSLKEVGNKKIWLTEDKQNYLKYNLEILKDNPFQPSVLMRVYGAYRQLHDVAHADVYLKKYRKLSDAILATGDGLTCETAYHVLNVSDEYSVLMYLGYKFGDGQSLTPDECDYLKIQKNDDNLKGVYFDVKQLFKGYSDMLNAGDKKSK